MSRRMWLIVMNRLVPMEFVRIILKMLVRRLLNADRLLLLGRLGWVRACRLLVLLL